MLVANFITKDSKIGDPTDESIRNIAKILINNRGLNFMYGVKYVLCNILALVSVVLSAHLIQVVLNHHFLRFHTFSFFYHIYFLCAGKKCEQNFTPRFNCCSYGLAFIGYQPMTIPEKNITIGDPLEFVFPKLAKCTFRYFASGGGGQTIDSLCTLPVNIINEKIFVAAW